MPLYTQKRVGFGQAVCFAMDATARSALPKALVKRVCTDSLKYLARLRKGRRAVDEQLSAEMIGAFGIDVPPRWKLGVYVFVYAVLVGPISYLVFRRRKHPEYGWLAFPALAAGFTVGAYRFGVISRYPGTVFREMSVIWVKAGSTVGAVMGYAGARSSRGRVLRVETRSASFGISEFPRNAVGAGEHFRTGQSLVFTPPSLVSGGRLRYWGSRRYLPVVRTAGDHGLWVEQGATNRVPALRLLPGALRLLSFEGYAKLAGSVQSTLAFDGNTLSGVIDNHTGIPWDCCWVRWINGLDRMREVKQGSSYQLFDINTVCRRYDSKAGSSLRLAWGASVGQGVLVVGHAIRSRSFCAKPQRAKSEAFLLAIVPIRLALKPNGRTPLSVPMFCRSMGGQSMLNSARVRKQGTRSLRFTMRARWAVTPVASGPAESNLSFKCVSLKGATVKVEAWLFSEQRWYPLGVRQIHGDREECTLTIKDITPFAWTHAMWVRFQISSDTILPLAAGVSYAGLTPVLPANGSLNPEQQTVNTN